MLFDTHAHLDSGRFDPDRDAVIARARQAGVTRIITCATDLASSEAAIDLAERNAGIWATVGVHPHEASAVCAEASEGCAVDALALARLCRMAARGAVVAVGEIGLDYHYDFSPREMQQAVFASQLKLAASLEMPVVLHNRESDDDFCRVFDDVPATIKGVLHCFSSDAPMAQWALSRGLYIGVDGPITFKKANALRSVIATVPLERLLIETDCPYLAPHPVRGKRNEPAYVRYVAEGLAALLGLDVDSVVRVTTCNAQELFRVG